MKLEPGQVWRRPDGTLWEVKGEPHKHDVCMKQITFNDPPPDETSFSLESMVAERWEMFPVLVVADTWTREVSAEAKRAYAALTGQQIERAIAQVSANGLSEGAVVFGADDIDPDDLPDRGT